MEQEESSNLDELHTRRPPGLGRWIVVSCCSVILAFLIHSYLLETYRIPSASMVPTLIAGDHVLVSRLSYLNSGPARGDVVVFERPVQDQSGRLETRYYVKRLVALPGDTVLLRNGKLYVNEEHLDERLVINPPAGDVTKHLIAYNFGPLRLKPDQFFVLGDNRENSEDSRYFGPIPLTSIHGRAFLIYWSWEHMPEGLAVKWSRFGQLVR